MKCSFTARQAKATAPLDDSVIILERLSYQRKDQGYDRYKGTGWAKF